MLLTFFLVWLTFFNDILEIEKTEKTKSLLKKLSDTITNESRSNVIDIQHAKYRGNKFLVIDIVNKFNINNHIDKITNSFYNLNIVNYKVNEIVVSDLFDNSLDSVCSNGIHYFKSIETAFHYEINKDYVKSGTYTEWYDNGQIKTKCNFVNNIKEGEYTNWSMNGQMNLKCNYFKDENDGEYKVELLYSNRRHILII